MLLAESHVKAFCTGDLHYLQQLSRASLPTPGEFLLCELAAVRGQLQVLQWSQNEEPPWQINAIRCAVLALEHGYQELLDWLRETFPGCLQDSCAELEAAGLGLVTALRCLKAHNPQSPWDSKTLLAAAMGGHMDALEIPVQSRSSMSIGCNHSYGSCLAR